MTTVAPPEVNTALLLLRTVVAKTFGFSLIESCNVPSSFPPLASEQLPAEALKATAASISVSEALALWNKEPGVAKVSFNLGKKLGGTVLPLSSSPAAGASSSSSSSFAAVLSVVQSGVTELLSSVPPETPIQVFRVTRQVLESKYGVVLPYDARSGGLVKDKEKKPVPGDPPPPPTPDRLLDVLALCYVPGLLFGVSTNGPTTATVGGLMSVEIETDDKGRTSSLSVGAKKVELVLKFKATTSTSASAGAAPASALADAPLCSECDLPPLSALAFLLEGSIGTAAARLFKAEADAASAAAGAAASAAASAKAAADKAKEDAEAKTGADADDAATAAASGGGGAAATAADEEMVVNAFEVKGKIDYEKLIREFGSNYVDEALLARLEAAVLKIGKVKNLHRFVRRGIFFSHRDLNRVLDLVEQGKPFYLYTGRGPSSQAMHLGHLVPFLMTQWLQEAFDVPLVIQMTDDEKFLFKGEYMNGEDNLGWYRSLTVENAKDIIACGFDKKKTFIFSDCEYAGHMYPNIVRIWKATTLSTVRAMFGFENSDNIGKIAFPAIQAAPSFPSSFPIPLKAGRDSTMACLIPCAIDQDPYFRLTRDIAYRLVPSNHPLGGKPALYHSKFFPPLQGALGKMSSSNDDSAVFLTDSQESIKSKIKAHAFSGGQETAALQREKGADLDVDVSYQWLFFFLEDDEELKAIGEDYKTGTGKYWATGMVKDRLIELLQGIVGEHQKRRGAVTDEDVKEWMKIRELEF